MCRVGVLVSYEGQLPDQINSLRLTEEHISMLILINDIRWFEELSISLSERRAVERNGQIFF